MRRQTQNKLNPPTQGLVDAVNDWFDHDNFEPASKKIIQMLENNANPKDGSVIEACPSLQWPDMRLDPPLTIVRWMQTPYSKLSTKDKVSFHQEAAAYFVSVADFESFYHHIFKLLELGKYNEVINVIVNLRELKKEHTSQLIESLYWCEKLFVSEGMLASQQSKTIDALKNLQTTFDIQFRSLMTIARLHLKKGQAKNWFLNEALAVEYLKQAKAFYLKNPAALDKKQVLIELYKMQADYYKLKNDEEQASRFYLKAAELGDKSAGEEVAILPKERKEAEKKQDLSENIELLFAQVESSISKTNLLQIMISDSSVDTPSPQLEQELKKAIDNNSFDSEVLSGNLQKHTKLCEILIKRATQLLREKIAANIKKDPLGLITDLMSKKVDGNFKDLQNYVALSPESSILKEYIDAERKEDGYTALALAISEYRKDPNDFFAHAIITLIKAGANPRHPSVKEELSKIKNKEGFPYSMMSMLAKPYSKDNEEAGKIDEAIKQFLESRRPDPTLPFKHELEIEIKQIFQKKGALLTQALTEFFYKINGIEEREHKNVEQKDIPKDLLPALRDKLLPILTTEIIQHAKFNDIIPLLFGADPTSFEDKLITEIKVELNKNLDVNNAQKLAKLAEHEFNFTKEIEQKKQLINKQIDLYVFMATEDGKFSSLAIQSLTSLAEKAKQVKDLNLMQKAERQLARVKYYAGKNVLTDDFKENKKQYTDEDKKPLRNAAKHNIFPAVYELDLWFENNKHAGGKSFENRRLYLCFKLLSLDPEQAKLEFPNNEIDFSVCIERSKKFINTHESKAVERPFYFTATSPLGGPYRHYLMATWYKFLYEKILPKIRNLENKDPVDSQMREWLIRDPDVFLLKAPDCYGQLFRDCCQKKKGKKLDFDKKDIEIIKERLKIDMINALGDKEWFKEKENQAQIPNSAPQPEQTSQLGLLSRKAERKEDIAQEMAPRSSSLGKGRSETPD